MDKTNTQNKNWWERNWKNVLIIGGVVIIVGIGVVVFKNKEFLLTFIKNGKKVINVTDSSTIDTLLDNASQVNPISGSRIVVPKALINNGEPFMVRSYIRNLPNNYHPSATKLAMAEIRGIILGPNQTFVDSYYKNAV